MRLRVESSKSCLILRDGDLLNGSLDSGNVPTMSPSQSGECSRAIRRMFVDAGLAIGAAVGISVASGGLGVGVAAWIYAFSAALVVQDRLDVDRLCGPGSPYYNPSTYGK